MNFSKKITILWLLIITIYWLGTFFSYNLLIFSFFELVLSRSMGKNSVILKNCHCFIYSKSCIWNFCQFYHIFLLQLIWKTGKTELFLAILGKSPPILLLPFWNSLYYTIFDIWLTPLSPCLSMYFMDAPRADGVINRKLVTKIEPNGVIQIQSEKIQVGDIICVEDGEEFPCDLLILSSSNQVDFRWKMNTK